MTVWVLIIIAGIGGDSGRAINTSLSFQTETECRAAQAAIPAETDFIQGAFTWRSARAACVKQTLGKTP